MDDSCRTRTAGAIVLSQLGVLLCNDPFPLAVFVH
jgi:hypothetical protein